ncbi:hypothetical protein RJ639_007904 [Escallonia herrerae]|uniref:pectinesterase n=1 Tax=Escallonia herrerae TaxID=1293975 RepID=A0AA89ASA4_9ASTE|nr:hypothetical protein RJ639_007904 [Escallonia herrerae]
MNYQEYGPDVQSLWPKSSLIGPPNQASSVGPIGLLSIWVVVCLVLVGELEARFARMEENAPDYITWDDMKVDVVHEQSLRLWLGLKYHQGSRVIVVDQSGKGDSVTVKGAIDMVPPFNTQRVKIYILPGIYREKVIVPASKPYISFIGNPDRTAETVITWNDKASDKVPGGELGTCGSATVSVESDYFCARGITFENSVVAVPGRDGMQAVALRIAGDRAMIYGVRILGSQDTLLDETGSHYFYQCYIQGFVDFICGNARSLYKDCELHSTAETTGAIAAHHRSSPDEDTGFSFANCKITGSGSIYLGRAWGNYSRAVYSQCDIANVVTPSGWSDWDDPWKQKTAEFGEYQCTGPGADRSKRVPWSKSLNDFQVQPFLDMNFIGGEQWLRL